MSARTEDESKDQQLDAGGGQPQEIKPKRKWRAPKPATDARSRAARWEATNMYNGHVRR